MVEYCPTPSLVSQENCSLFNLRKPPNEAGLRYSIGIEDCRDGMAKKLYLEIFDDWGNGVDVKGWQPIGAKRFDP